MVVKKDSHLDLSDTRAHTCVSTSLCKSFMSSIQGPNSPGAWQAISNTNLWNLGVPDLGDP
jgi:hypothetical protein